MRPGEDNFIQVTGRLDRDKDRIQLCFDDNGKGVTAEEAAELNRQMNEQDDFSHIGLRNVHSRLRIMFGKESYVRVESKEPEPGIRVMLVFGREPVKLPPFDSPNTHISSDW